LIWKSRSELIPNQRVFVVIGIVKNPSDSLYVVYYDSNNSTSME